MSTAAADSRAPARPARYRGLFAPSPTGPLHFGSLVAALASYCDARAANGEWLVRIEDVDYPAAAPAPRRRYSRRSNATASQWDGEVVRQSDRVALYEEALEALRASGRVYACTCTRRELDAAPMGFPASVSIPGPAAVVRRHRE